MPLAVFGFAPTAYTDKAGFRIPNPRTTSYPALERWTETDHQIQDLAHLGQGILRGCRVRAFTPATYKLKVGSGQITVRGATASLAACEVIPNPPSGTLPRIDVVGIHILSSGAAHVQMFAGTPSNNPFPPLMDPAYVALDFVFIPASCGAIYSAQLVSSKRVFVHPSGTVLAGNLGGTTFDTFAVYYGGLTGSLHGTVEAAVQVVCPRSGTLRNLYVVTTSGQDPAGPLQINVQVNGSAAGIQLLIPASAPAGSYKNVSDTAQVAAGDLLSLEIIELPILTTSAGVGPVSLGVEG